MDFHQTVNYRGIRVTASAAGHVLGAAMFNVEIDGVKVLYTGDYSMEDDRYCNALNNNSVYYMIYFNILLFSTVGT